jgi:DNA mismatch repair protein MutS2
MSNIVYIVNHATPKSLCLFDELGGGTDPVEGAALAIAILNTLKNAGTKCMATTHYSELKTYALSTDRVENASCEFDVATLQPTYKLMIGIPGKSNAFAISKKLGLPEYIISSAKEQLKSDAVDMETLIAELEQSKRTIKADEEAIAAYKREIEDKRKKLAEKESELAEKKSKILDEARAEARDIVDEAKAFADKTISEYNKWRTNPSKADMKEMEKKRSNLRDRLKGYENEGAAKPKQTSNLKAKDVHIGDLVYVISLESKGTISSMPDSNGRVDVTMGVLKMQLSLSDLTLVEESTVSTNVDSLKNEAKKSGKSSYRPNNKAMTFSPEINVMGMTVSEAISAIDKFLDDARLTHMSKVTIIHGKGTGALRKGIHEYLRKQKHVKSYRIGEYGEGEYGVTIVEL